MDCLENIRVTCSNVDVGIRGVVVILISVLITVQLNYDDGLQWKRLTVYA